MFVSLPCRIILAIVALLPIIAATKIRQAQKTPLAPADVGPTQSPTAGSGPFLGLVSINVTPAIVAMPPTMKPVVETVLIEL